MPMGAMGFAALLCNTIFPGRGCGRGRGRGLGLGLEEALANAVNFDTTAETAPLLVGMGNPNHDDSLSDRAADLKAFHIAAISEPKLSLRTAGKTFETGSFEAFYKPIDEYEGAHRFDPEFEWEEKEERRVVRRVSALRERK